MGAPSSKARDFNSQGNPRHIKMSNTLLPIEFDTAMSPKPETIKALELVKGGKN